MSQKIIAGFCVGIGLLIVAPTPYAPKGLEVPHSPPQRADQRGANTTSLRSSRSGRDPRQPVNLGPNLGQSDIFSSQVSRAEAFLLGVFEKPSHLGDKLSELDIPSAQRNGLALIAIQNLLERDPDSALTAVDSIHDKELRESLLTTALLSIAETRPLEAFESAVVRNATSALAAIASEAWTHNPDAALAAVQHESGVLQISFVAGIVGERVTLTSEQVDRLVRMTNPEAHDDWRFAASVHTQLLRSLIAEHPDQVRQAISRIGSLVVRDQIAAELAFRQFPRDEYMARKWLLDFNGAEVSSSSAYLNALISQRPQTQD